MMSRTHRNAFAIQYGGEIVCVHPLRLERKDGALARRITDDPQPIEFAHRLAGDGKQRNLMRLDCRTVERRSN